MGIDFTFLGTWGLAVLLAVVGGTEYFKRWLKRMGYENNWIFMSLPIILGGGGAFALSASGKIGWCDFLLYWGFYGLGGNAAFKIWKRFVMRPGAPT